MGKSRRKNYAVNDGAPEPYVHGLAKRTEKRIIRALRCRNVEELVEVTDEPLDLIDENEWETRSAYLLTTQL